MFTNPTFTATATATAFNGSLNGNSSTSSKWLNARTLTMSGDLSGSVIIDGSTNMTLTANVADDSHNHVISNVDGLQIALDNKSNISHNHDDVYVKLGALTWNQLKGV
jgi:hypothetical protein